MKVLKQRAELDTRSRDLSMRDTYARNQEPCGTVEMEVGQEGLDHNPDMPLLRGQTQTAVEEADKLVNQWRRRWRKVRKRILKNDCELCWGQGNVSGLDK